MGFDSALDALKKGASKVNKGVKQLSDNFSKDKEIRALKEELLRQLTVSQLKGVKKKQGIVFAQERLGKREKLLKDDYISNLAKKLSFDKVIEIAKRKKISKEKINQIKYEKKEIESKYKERKEKRWSKDDTEPEEVINEEKPQLKKLVKYIRDLTLPSKIADERELHNVIFTNIKNNGDFEEVYSEPNIEGMKPDIVAENIAIELKVPKSRKDFDSGFFQALRYNELEDIEGILLVIYATDEKMFELAKEYDEKYSEEHDVVTITKTGSKRNTRVKWRYPKISVNYE